MAEIYIKSLYRDHGDEEMLPALAVLFLSQPWKNTFTPAVTKIPSYPFEISV